MPGLAEGQGPLFVPFYAPKIERKGVERETASQKARAVAGTAPRLPYGCMKSAVIPEFRPDCGDHRKMLLTPKLPVR